jgi:hypothetical protein
MVDIEQEMNNNGNISVLVTKRLTIPKRLTGKDLYDILNVDERDDALLLMDSKSPNLEGSYHIRPDDEAIEFALGFDIDELPEHMFIVVKGEGHLNHKANY